MKEKINYDDLVAEQRKICEKYNIPWVETPLDMRVGLMKNFADGQMPLNGLRHPPDGGTAGWYLWAGVRWTTDINEWDALHISHLSEQSSFVAKYLGLPPGYRFLVDDKGHEDVWFDQVSLI